MHRPLKKMKWYHNRSVGLVNAGRTWWWWWWWWWLMHLFVGCNSLKIVFLVNFSMFIRCQTHFHCGKAQRFSGLNKHFRLHNFTWVLQFQEYLWLVSNPNVDVQFKFHGHYTLLTHSSSSDWVQSAILNIVYSSPNFH